MTCTKRNRTASWGAALAILALIPATASAADLPIPVLRGSVGAAQWEGFVVGGHFGRSSMDTDFGNSAGPMVAFILRDTTIENEGGVSQWTTLNNDLSNSPMWGVFAGYNWQLDQIVVGFDLAYNRMQSMKTSASDTESRQFTTSDGFDNNVTVIAQSSLELVDYATLRGRVGYAYGSILPYAVFGGVIGRFNYATTAHVIASGTPTGAGSPYTLDQSQTDAKDNAYAAGWVFGAGVDVALLANLFVRAEWDFMSFATIDGIHTNLNTGKVGVGFKF